MGIRVPPCAVIHYCHTGDGFGVLLMGRQESFQCLMNSGLKSMILRVKFLM